MSRNKGGMIKSRGQLWCACRVEFRWFDFETPGPSSLRGITSPFLFFRTLEIMAVVRLTRSGTVQSKCSYAKLLRAKNTTAREDALQCAASCGARIARGSATTG